MNAPSDRRFPIQGGLTIAWAAAERAFRSYSRSYGTQQSLERLAERGGFGLLEFAILYESHDPAREWAKQHDKLIRQQHRLAEILMESDVRRDR